MLLVALIAATLAAVLHVQFFVLESLRFTRPAVWRRFGIASQHDADVIRPMAFNQGWYNLFLALGVVAGVVAVASGRTVVGASLIGFGGACMAGAGAVLLATDRRFAPAAALQAGPPLVALIALAVATV